MQNKLLFLALYNIYLVGDWEVASGLWVPGHD